MSPRRNWESPIPSLACGWGVGGVPIPTTGEKESPLQLSLFHFEIFKIVKDFPLLLRHK